MVTVTVVCIYCYRNFWKYYRRNGSSVFWAFRILWQRDWPWATSAHAIGTAKALELGEVEGAMSSLSIAVAGILTVIAVPLAVGLI